MADYDMADGFVSDAVLVEANAILDELLFWKNEHFKALDKDEAKAVLSKDPEHCSRLIYNETVFFGLTRTSVQRLFVDLAISHGIFKGNLAQDSAICSNLARLSQAFLYNRKHRENMVMPMFLVETDGKKVFFHKATVKVASMEKVTPTAKGILAARQQRLANPPTVTTAPEPTQHQIGGNTEPVKQPQKFHEDVAKVQADKAKAAEQAKQQLEYNRLLAENAALKAKQEKTPIVEASH